MANWESEIREKILLHGQFSTTCLEKDPVKRNRNNLAKNWRKKNTDKIKNAVEKWREKNPGKQNGYQKKWAAKNPDYWKNYNKLHPEKKKEWNKKWREKRRLQKESRAHFTQAVKLDGELKELIDQKQEKE